MFEIEGLDELQKGLQQAQDALAELDGELGQVSFDPVDPASIELAISSVEKLVDEKVAGFEGNEFVASIVEEMKTAYRSQILEKASEARIQDGG